MSDNRWRLGPEEQPTNAYLRDLHRRTMSRRKRVHPTVQQAGEYLPPWEWNKVRFCCKAFMRWHDAKTQVDTLGGRRCSSSWCAWCPHLMHVERTRFQGERLKSLDPSLSRDSTPVLQNHVFELPVIFHDLALRDPRILTAFQQAIRRTIADVYGYKGRKSRPVDRIAFSELGAIVHLHPWGDRGKPWPKWAPHYDVLLANWRLHEGKVETLGETWPESYAKTRAKYREHLRAALKPVAERPERKQDLLDFLETDFKVIWHISKTRDGASEIHRQTAMHRIWYSSRPHFELAKCRFEKTATGTTILTYRPDEDGDGAHHVPPGPAFQRLQALEIYWKGREARRFWGTLHGEAYIEAATAAGNEPVREQRKTGKVLIKAYVKDENGDFRVTDPRDIR